MITPEQEKAIHEALKSLGIKDFNRLEIEGIKAGPSFVSTGSGSGFGITKDRRLLTKYPTMFCVIFVYYCTRF